MVCLLFHLRIDFGLCLLLVLSLLLSKSIFIAGPTLCPKTCSFIEWLLISMGCSGFFLSVNLHWWSYFGVNDHFRVFRKVFHWFFSFRILLIDRSSLLIMLLFVKWDLPCENTLYFNCTLVFTSIWFNSIDFTNYSLVKNNSISKSILYFSSDDISYRISPSSILFRARESVSMVV